ncbi:hypothetical protein K438DRAFT_1976414 [Mycena galopus ATCC 62051]|nr:hypothetical protein K438DRAFT_1976414 [Mycena galopus ATCC 62051]
MDESQSLDALLLEGMREDALAAMEMMTSFFAAGEDVWLTLIKTEEETLDLDSASGVEELLTLYKHAEEDDLCTLCDSHTQETRGVHSDNWTRNALSETDYESFLVKASKFRGQAVKAFQRRETWETSLESRTPEAYPLYIASERRAKNPSYPILSTLYERAIADTARQRFSGEQGAEETLRAFWEGYCDIARILEAGISMELDILQRAVGSVPGSGEVWARYICCLNVLRTKTKRQFKASQSDIEQLVPVLLACAGYDKRRYDGTDGVPCSTLPQKHYKTSYNAWISYTGALIKNRHHDMACKTFVDLHLKNLDWPEAIWEAWLAFEHLHGSVQQIDVCGDKVEKAQYVVNTRCAKQAAQYTAEQMESVPVAQAPLPEISPAEPMDVDLGPRGTKLTAEDDSKPTPLKRAYSTVFVADLPAGVTDEELTAIFKDDLHRCSPSPAN